MSQLFIDHSSRFEQADRYFLGATVSQPPGGAAVCVIRRRQFYEYRGHARNPIRDLKATTFEVGHIERLRSGLAYPAVIARIGEIQRLPIYGDAIEVVINATEVGGSFIELCHSAGLYAEGVAITTGDTEVGGDRYVRRIPQAELVARIQTLIHDGKLSISKHIPDADGLVRELQNFRLHRSEGGRVRFGGIRGDGVATALAVAIWQAMNSFELIVEEFRI